MADQIQEILNDVFSGKSEAQADTATTETTPATETAAEVIETSAVVTEETNNESSFTEVTEEVTTKPATTVTTEATPETKVESPIDTLIQKLGVKNVEEISERLTELQAIKEKNTLGKLIDESIEKGIDPITAITFHKLDVNALAPKEKIAWNMKMEHPTLTDEQISALIEEEYGDESNLAQQAKLAIAGEAAGKALAEQKRAILDPVATNKEAVAKQQELNLAEEKRVAEWKSTPKVKEILSTLGKIEQKVTFSTHGEDKPVNKTFNFAYQIPKDGLEEIESALRNVGVAQGLDPNAPESAAHLKQMAENLYWIQNKGKVMASLANTIASHFTKEQAQKFHNASPNKGGVFIDTGKQTVADQRLEATIKNL